MMVERQASQLTQVKYRLRNQMGVHAATCGALVSYFLLKRLFMRHGFPVEDELDAFLGNGDALKGFRHLCNRTV